LSKDDSKISNLLPRDAISILLRELASAFETFGNESIPAALEHRGMSPSALNMLISGCCDLGDSGPAIADAILDWMWATGRNPSLLHYHALIKVHDRRRGGGGAANAIADLRARGLSPTVITYNLALRALRNGGAMPRALALLDEMEAAGAPPDVVTYNTLLAGLSYYVMRYFIIAYMYVCIILYYM
jgi:pentatricopeptide repeat protein